MNAFHLLHRKISTNRYGFTEESGIIDIAEIIGKNFVRKRYLGNKH